MKSLGGSFVSPTAAWLSRIADDLLTWSRTEFGAGSVKCVTIMLPG